MYANTQTNPSNVSRFVAILWVIFFTLHILAGKIVYFYPLTLLFAVISILVTIWTKNLNHFNWFEELEKQITWRRLALYFGIVITSVLATKLLRFESYDATLWDFAQYLQATFYQATTGSPKFTLGGQWNDYDLIHRSISLPVIASVYNFFPSPWVLLVWNCVFYLLPGFICCLWYREITRSNKTTPYKIGYLLSFWLILFSPIAAGQLLWPYTFHIAGITLFALSYLFFYKGKYLYWALLLTIMSFEKEDFGIITATFGLVGLIEAFLTRPSKPKMLATLSFALIAIGVFSYFDFSSPSGPSSTFISRFGHIADTPFGVLTNLLISPIDTLSWAFREKPLGYLAFFLLVSFVWWKPRWNTVKYFIPIAPILLANILTTYEPMHSLKDHYSWPLLVGSAATLVFGVMSKAMSENHRPLKPYAILIVALFISSLFGQANPIRQLKVYSRIWTERSEERKVLGSLKNQKDVVICCEGRLCSGFANRRAVIRSAVCARGAPILSEFIGMQAVYLVYAKPSVESHISNDLATSSNLPFVPVPLRWESETEMIKLSAPIEIKERKTLAQAESP